MKKTLYLTLLLTLFLTSCTKKSSPITLTIWHVYGGQTDSPLNDKIELYNKTEGKENGINIQVTSVSNTNSIHDAVIAASYKEPGASELPDIFISYPKTVIAMKNSDVLIDYEDYFSKEELANFVPEFLKEGYIDDKLYVLPVAKSTEIMFINKTIFDRFSADTGIKIEDLDTWDKLFEVSQKYVDWSDVKTPDISNDGKAFFVHDYHFNYFQVGVTSLGTDFFNNNQINFDATFNRVWQPYARAAVYGGVWLKEGYATEPLRTGDAVVSVASSASVLYYNDLVTYPDNTSEKAELISRPCPVFSDGEKMVMQRGAGICTVKSTPEREKAAISFIKWLISPENNVDFVTRAGYMPVTTEAFDKYLPLYLDKLESSKYQSLYEAFLKTNSEYKYYTPPQLSSYLSLEKRFESNVRNILQSSHDEYLKSVLIYPEDASNLIDVGAYDAYTKLYEIMR